jgi:hypothetical protein
MADYQGWKNYKTWNVAMHIGNDHGLYQMARYMAEDGLSYRDFAKELVDTRVLATEDGVAWNDPELDYAHLDEMMHELSTSNG